MAVDPSTVLDLSDALVVEQYKSLRSEIERHDQHRARIEYASTLGSALILAWVLDKMPWYDWKLAIVYGASPIVVLCAGRRIAQSHVARSKVVGDFIREKIEPNMPTDLRWEAYFQDNRGKVSRATRIMFGTFLIFEFILVGSKFVSLYSL